MLPVDFPTRPLLLALAAARADVCVSIFVETTPVTSEIGASRIALGNAAREALAQASARGLARGRAEALAAALAEVDDDEGFWAHQARTLAVLATPDGARTFRLASRVAPTVEVSDRFHLKPLLRAAANPRAGFVLALGENSVRLVEVAPDLPAETVAVPGLPAGAADAVGKASINDRSHDRRIGGSEGKKVRLAQYARAVDAALRPVLPAEGAPLVLAANAPLDAVFRSVSALPGLLADGFGGEVDRMTPAELAAAALSAFDAAFAARVAAARALHERRAGQGRATTDLADAARAAARGAVESLLVDMDALAPGTFDAETGAVTFAAAPGPDSYAVTDAVALAAFATGADVLAVRAADLPGASPVAATLRYAG